MFDIPALRSWFMDPHADMVDLASKSWTLTSSVMISHLSPSPFAGVEKQPVVVSEVAQPCQSCG
jgi:hypothetical protein